MSPPPWWRDAVIYQIYPRSFCDDSGDGVGDLAGIIRNLDHLAWLGVDGVWLSPIYRSPMADFGYDVADHCDVDPLFGDLAIAEQLIEEAHARGIRVLLDFVPNHTSSEHPWFVAARSDVDDPHRDWYVWRDPAADGGPPNAWVAAFDRDAPAWTLDPGSGQYYLHLFLPEQPDLDWNHPAVELAQQDVLRFWLERGVDGFRADVVHLIGKDPALPDDPRDHERESRVGFHFEPDRLLPLLRGLRRTIDAYDQPDTSLPGERMIVGEVNLADDEQIVACYDGGRGLHLAFNFALLRSPFDADVWRRTISDLHAVYDPVDAWPTWVLSNHDEPRHRTRYGGRESRARVAATLLLTLRGTPFLYAGEELGLEDAAVDADTALDPGGRDGCRAPIPWQPGGRRGWAGIPWLPWPPDPDDRSVAVERDDRDSVLWLYRRLLEARRASPALRRGSLRLLDTPSGVLAYERAWEDDRRVVVLSTAAEPMTLPLEGAWRLEVASDGRGRGMPFDGLIEPERALLLAPASDL